MSNNKRNVTRPKVDSSFHLKTIEPKTDNQRKVFESDKHQVLHGSAGTGKTIITSFIGYKKVLRGEHSSLVYMRSAVPTRNIGFLPGTEAEKTDVYEKPYRDIATELFDRGDAYDNLKNKGIVKFTTTSHVRGITFNDIVLIVDECQNMTYQELDSIITRIGDNCLVFFCGDWHQKDLKDTGIREFYNVLRKMKEFDFVDFSINDVVRSPLVKNYLRAKYESNFEQSNLPERRPRITDLLGGTTDLQSSELQQSYNTYSNSELRNGETWSNEPADRAD